MTRPTRPLSSHSAEPAHRPPPPRGAEELRRVLTPQAARSAAARAADSLPGLNVLLVAGPKDHGPGEHDYPWFQQTWSELLSTAPGVRVLRAAPWPTASQWQAADLAVFYFWCHNWTDAHYADLDRFLARGGGLVCLHAAIIEDHHPERLAQRIGLAGRRPTMQYRHGPITLRFHTQPADNGLCRGFSSLDLVDETYWTFSGDPKRVRVLATSNEAGQPQPQIWTYQPAAGRVYCNVLGHFRWTFDDPLFRVLLLRGMAWSARQPLDRLEHLALSATS